MYEDKTPEKIRADIIAALNPDRNHLWDTREGSFADDQASPMALELSKVYNSLNEIEFIVWVNETSGPYIDLAIDTLGLEPRKMGSKARAELKITATPGFVITAGKTFLTTDDYAFLTLKETVIPGDGTAAVVVEAKEIGYTYNVAANTITQQFSNDAAIIAVTNTSPATGGTDVESDKSLYARLDLARKRPRTSGNKYHYEEWALEVPGVDSVRVFPLRFGRGSVMVLIADKNRRPVDQTIIETCYAHISDKMACGGIELTVKTPIEVVIDISVSVELDGTVSLDAVQAGFTDKLKEYFSQISLVKSSVIRSKVAGLLSDTIGVADFFNLLLNGQQENVPLSDEGVPILSEVVIT